MKQKTRKATKVLQKFVFFKSPSMRVTKGESSEIDYVEMEFGEETPDRDDNDGGMCSRVLQPSVENNSSNFLNANQSKPELNCTGQTVTGWKSCETHSLENIKEMLRLGAGTGGSDVARENSCDREASASDISEEFNECFGLARIFENVDVNTSEEFLFKDTYFEDMESLEFVYEPILCLSRENLVADMIAPSKTATHCIGCNCTHLQLDEPSAELCLKQDPGEFLQCF